MMKKTGRIGGSDEGQFETTETVLMMTDVRDEE